MSFLSNETTTQNGMPAHISTENPLVDLFFSIGAARNNVGIIQMFLQCFNMFCIDALRILFWSRDVRGGAGERAVFRSCMLALETIDRAAVVRNLRYVPEYGRWDDLLTFVTCRDEAFAVIKQGLEEGNALCAKWMPRKGPIAVALRNYLKMSPKQYRKTLVGLSSTVEQQMCARQWGQINFSGVPSIASKQYQNAFKKHQLVRYTAWQTALADGTEKINASAIFPHDVIVGLKNGQEATAEAQWKALPDYLADTHINILPMVDVSGSMQTKAGKSNATCMDISIALGLYIAERQNGPFKDEVLTFDSRPRFVRLMGTLQERYAEALSMPWGGSTDVVAALDVLLNKAVAGHVPQNEMPHMLLILSDMQFNSHMGNQTFLQTMRFRYRTTGYEMPKIVFWNLNGQYGNVPATISDEGVVMVSGFSPAILKTVLVGDMDNFTPAAMMYSVINSPRYQCIM